MQPNSDGSQTSFRFQQYRPQFLDGLDLPVYYSRQQQLDHGLILIGEPPYAQRRRNCKLTDAEHAEPLV